MTLPPGFTCPIPGKVCRLQKSLYGLRQAPCQWFAKLSTKLREYDFVHSSADYFLFTCKNGHIFMALLVYVDNIVLASNNSQASNAFKTYLHACFSIKDLGPLKYFLGIEIARGPKRLFLSQRKYALEVVDECGLLGAKPSDIPIEENHWLALAGGPLLDDASRYRWLVGRLIYLTITRHDLRYAIHILSQFMQAPRQEHMAAANKVLQYIKGSPNVVYFSMPTQLFNYQHSVTLIGAHAQLPNAP